MLNLFVPDNACWFDDALIRGGKAALKMKIVSLNSGLRILRYSSEIVELGRPKWLMCKAFFLTDERCADYR